MVQVIWNIRTHCMFATSSIFKLGNIHSLNLANFMFKQSHNLLPHKIQGFFLASASVHTHRTCGLAKWNLFVRTEFFLTVFFIKESFTGIV